MAVLVLVGSAQLVWQTSAIHGVTDTRRPCAEFGWSRCTVERTAPPTSPRFGMAFQLPDLCTRATDRNDCCNAVSARPAKRAAHNTGCCHSGRQDIALDSIHSGSPPPPAQVCDGQCGEQEIRSTPRLHPESTAASHSSSPELCCLAASCRTETRAQQYLPLAPASLRRRHPRGAFAVSGPRQMRGAVEHSERGRAHCLETVDRRSKTARCRSSSERPGKYWVFLRRARACPHPLHQ